MSRDRLFWVVTQRSKTLPSFLVPCSGESETLRSSRTPTSIAAVSDMYTSFMRGRSLGSVSMHPRAARTATSRRAADASSCSQATKAALKKSIDLRGIHTSGSALLQDRHRRLSTGLNYQERYG